MDFTALHHQPHPLLIANVWDAGSARAAQQAGYQALGTSSAAIATMLGYDDGEAMSIDELIYIVTRIRAVTDLPLSVDVEAGYGETPEHIADNIQRLVALGVVGINLEDSHVVRGVRQLDSAAGFARTLQHVRRICPDVFLNARTDTFLLNVDNALQETLSRGRVYAQQGANGLFVPCVTQPDDIATIAHEVRVPLNVMCMPGLADFSTLASLGVRRISMGNFVHAALQQQLQDLLCRIQSDNAFTGIFAHENHG